MCVNHEMTASAKTLNTSSTSLWLTPLPLIPAPCFTGKHWSAFCHCESLSISYHLSKLNNNIHILSFRLAFLSIIILGIICVVLMLMYLYFVPFYGSIPLHGYTNCLPIDLLMDISVVSGFLLLQIRLLWYFMHKSLYWYMLFSLGLNIREWNHWIMW